MIGNGVADGTGLPARVSRSGGFFDSWLLFGIIQDVRPPAHGWLEYTINGINRQILFDTGNKPRRDRNLIGMREYGLWILLAQCYERNGCLPHFSPVLLFQK